MKFFKSNQKYTFAASQRNRKIARLFNKVIAFHINHRDTVILILSIAISIMLLRSSTFNSFVATLAKFGIISSFILGFLFAFGFTTAPAISTLYLLAEHVNPFLIATLAAAGAMIANYFIFNFVRNHFIYEIRSISLNYLKYDFSEFELMIKKHLVKSKSFRNIFPALTGFIISLPLPTEMFVSIMWTIANYDSKKILPLSYIFSFLGILNLGLLKMLFR